MSYGLPHERHRRERCGTAELHRQGMELQDREDLLPGRDHRRQPCAAERTAGAPEGVARRDGDERRQEDRARDSEANPRRTFDLQEAWSEK